ncbi:hypothetical protein HBH53_134160 [Parastagonospora nodorum]|nr:hypothetical protein HBH53_134160 [Parastagonospora nodorum]
MLFLTSCAIDRQLKLYYNNALDICAKDDLTYNRRLAGELATAESVTAKDPNYVDTFSSDFAFSFAT